MKRILRVILAICFFCPFVLYFLDFAELYPKRLNFLMELQIVPAFMKLNLWILGGIFLLTLLFGRIYCSVICPLGVFQDLTAWTGSFFRKKKKYGFHPPKTVLRFLFLAVFLLSGLLGFSAGLYFLDPYSIFGRLTASLFSPVYCLGNNLLAYFSAKFEIGDFYHVTAIEGNAPTLIFSAVMMILIVYLAIRFGRIWCNAVCPIGTILGLVSRLAIFRIRIDRSKCNHCGLCAGKCKSSCINNKEQTVDLSRCVACFNCLNGCPKGAISWGIGFSPSQKSNPLPENKDPKGPDQKKRDFLITLSAAAAALTLPEPAAKKTKETIEKESAPKPDEDPAKTPEPYGLIPYHQEEPISPPGAISREHFTAKCTACHLCVNKCPADVLQPAVLEYGLAGIMQPQMIFKYGFCNFDCTLCTEVCPNGALVKLSMDEKHREQMGQVHFIKENCIVFADETSCGACSEHCPTQAVRMVPYKGELTIPEIDPEICVGCGGCEHICPARPYRAIYVDGNRVHLKAKPFKEAEKKEIKLDDFGF
ncbi:MAG: 4Fe-4S dicluster domain-containing protein [Planctomycetia bacterium]|nr:4Fe-4S dicluster domain-containing protein [Planctomycetia bacterium]